ncbi:MAG: Uma2 family endonuclease [Chloroflexi bacterium]|nr:Uma2 family endonuclease [Chloroflexota bacterium]
MTTPTPMPQLARRRFTVDEYHQMATAGILGENDRVELINGEVVEMAPIGPPHNGAVNRFNRVFTLRFQDVAVVQVQGSIRLDRHNEPEPDLALLRDRADFYATALAGPSDILALVEVGDTSAALDWLIKAPVYAQYGVPELLLVNLSEDALTVCRDPGPDGYRSVVALRRGDVWTPLAFPDRPIAVADLLGPPR